MSSDESIPDRVARAREQLPVTRDCAYLNTGTAGPIPLLSHAASEEAARTDLTKGRGNFTTFKWVMEKIHRARELAARVMGADPDETALTHHTSQGIHIVLSGIDWKPGDRVVTTSLEHDAVTVPLGLLRKRYGVELVFADIASGEEAVSRLGHAIDCKAKMVIVSHVAYSSGVVLPVEEIAGLCRQAGALLLVDGAQSCGAMPLDVHGTGADFYTLSGQKWLCGPEGTGALFVRREALGLLQPIQGSYFSAAENDFHGHVELHPDARRFETGMINRPALAGFVASMEWILDEIGLDQIHRRSLHLALICRERLGRIEGAVLVTPEARQGPLVTVDLPEFSPARLHNLAFALSAEGIVIRSIDHPPYGLRASLGFFNTEAEVDRFAAAVKKAVDRGPGAVEIKSGAGLPDHR